MKAIFSLLIFGMLVVCNNKQSKQGENRVDILKNGQYDFSAIGAAVKDKRIVALGESSHGIGNYYAFKAALVQYLHHHHDFEVLAFEAGLGDLNLAYSGLDSLSADELLNQTLFGNFRCEEVTPLFDYIKSVHRSDYPLIYTGFDNQMSSSFFEKTIIPVLETYNPALADTLESALFGYVRWFRAGQYQDSIKFENEAVAFRKVANDIASIFRNEKSEIVKQFDFEELDFQFIDQTCKGFVRTVEIPFSDVYRGSAHRDAIMFDNFQWLMNEIFPDKKVIIWAHNSHIEQQPMHENSFKWMGHYLNDEYQDDYYALGLFAKEGEYYRQWGDTTITFNLTDPNMLEVKAIASDLNTTFIDMSDDHHEWLGNTVDALEPENGGKVSFVPNKRFDGVVVMQEVVAPRF